MTQYNTQQFSDTEFSQKWDLWLILTLLQKKERKKPNLDFPSDLKIIGDARVFLSINTGGCMFSRVNGKDEYNCESLRKLGS